MTPQEWAKCVIVLRSCYPNTFKLDNEGIAVWYEMLSDLPYQAAAGAIRHMAQTQRAFPSIADIRAIAQPQQATDDAVWAEVMSYCNSAHVFGAVWQGGREVAFEWSDPELGKLVLSAFDGGREIANATPERLGFIKSQLFKMWAAKKNALAIAEKTGLSHWPIPKQIGERL